MRRKRFQSSDLRRIAAAEEFSDPREPPFRIGDVVRLNSGGPTSLVVEIEDAETVTVAWRNEAGRVEECVFPRPCVHRVRDLW